MNENNLTQTTNEHDTLQSIVISEVRQKISNTANDAENTAKEKYIAKQKLIESADDMTTHEKLNAMDKNYDRRNQERWEYPKVCVNLQTDVRYNYSVWRLFLWQEEKTAHKKQQ